MHSTWTRRRGNFYAYLAYTMNCDDQLMNNSMGYPSQTSLVLIRQPWMEWNAWLARTGNSKEEH